LSILFVSMMTDIAAYRRESNLDTLHIVSNGCPDHAYFQHVLLQTSFSINGDLCPSTDNWSSDGDCSSSSSSSSNNTSTTDTTTTSITTSGNPFYNNPNVPRFIAHQFTVPVHPVLTGTIQRPDNDDQPIGIAINGVVFFTEHSTRASDIDFDSGSGSNGSTHVFNYTVKVDNVGVMVMHLIATAITPHQCV
jgi:hypothetical protein